MKLTKIVVISLITVSGLVLSTTQALADAANSNAELEYSKKTGTTDPVHPIDPDPNPVTPIDPPTGNEGDLTVDYVSNIKFGKNEIANKDMVYYGSLTKVTKADGTQEDVPNYVQISDDRGTLAGWNLKVKQNGELSAGTAKLVNTTLTFKNGVSKSNNTSEIIYSPTVPEAILTPTGGSQLIVDAKAQQGMGTWTARFGTDNVEGAKSIELMVPWNSAKAEGMYSTSLTWELGNTPG